jgi:hypothetical protein
VCTGSSRASVCECHYASACHSTEVARGSRQCGGAAFLVCDDTLLCLLLLQNTCPHVRNPLQLQPPRPHHILSDTSTTSSLSAHYRRPCCCRRYNCSAPVDSGASLQDSLRLTVQHHIRSPKLLRRTPTYRFQYEYGSGELSLYSPHTVYCAHALRVHVSVRDS